MIIASLTQHNLTIFQTIFTLKLKPVILYILMSFTA